MYLSVLALLAIASQTASLQPSNDHYWRDKMAATPEEQARTLHNDSLKPKFFQYQNCVFNEAKRMATSKETAPVVAGSALQSCKALRVGLYTDFSATYVERKAFFEAFDRDVLAETTMRIVDARSRPRRKK